MAQQLLKRSSDFITDDGFIIIDKPKIVVHRGAKKAARRLKRKVAVIDFETDPFKYGRIPHPFCCEFYSDDITQVFWGPDCADQLAEWLEKQEQAYLIYAHNGGKFDFHFLLKYIENPALIIKTRIVSAKLFHHEIRDSFAILPVPLRDYDKMEFDYSKMEPHCREKNKAEILEYLHSDCLNLFALVHSFVERFGPRLTIGGTAIREIQKLHPFQKSGSRHDKVFRDYYFGGRVQCFQTGIIRGPVKLVDRNSMYPAAMAEKLHPINGRFDYGDTMPDNFDMPFFVKFRGRNNNALPCLDDDGSLTFTRRDGIFYACSHELEVALEHNLVQIDEVLECLVSTQAISFREFVELHYNLKSEAKAEGDKITELFEKLLLNSGYGRTGINPANFADWIIHRDFGNDEELIEQGYTQTADYEVVELWSRPAQIKEEQYCDVAIAASITSASRANLLQNLQLAIEPMYCDTDSIMCREFTGDTDKYRLGAWDEEKITENVAIAGKKLYAMYSDDALTQFKGTKRGNGQYQCAKCKLAFSNPKKHREHQLECKVKLSSKGGSLNLDEIVRICQGETIRYENDAPTFSLKDEPRFISRNFARTGAFEETLDLAELVD